MENYVITIARGFGSGGKDIAERLSKVLQIPCYEKEILTMASEQSGLSENLFNLADEKMRGSQLAKLVKKLSHLRASGVEAVEKEFVSDEELYSIQVEIIKKLAETQSCIIVGKCADYILKNNKNVISLYIEAPRAYCVQSVMDKMQVSKERANELIKKTDKYRAEYYKFYTGGNYWTNPVNYDLTLNSDRIGRENCVKIIKAYAKEKFNIG